MRRSSAFVAVSRSAARTATARFGSSSSSPLSSAFSSLSSPHTYLSSAVPPPNLWVPTRGPAHAASAPPSLASSLFPSSRPFLPRTHLRGFSAATPTSTSTYTSTSTTIPTPIPTPSSPTPPVTAPPSTLRAPGTAGEDKKGEKQSWFKVRYVLAAGALYFAASQMEKHQREKVIEAHKEELGMSETEATELVGMTLLRTEDVEHIYRQTRKLYRGGLLPVDPISQLVHARVTETRAARKKKREAAAALEASIRKQVEAEFAAKQQQSAEAKPLNNSALESPPASAPPPPAAAAPASALAPSPSMNAIDDWGDDPKLDSEPLRTWVFVPLFRSLPLPLPGRAELPDVMTALALIIQDFAVPPERRLDAPVDGQRPAGSSAVADVSDAHKAGRATPERVAEFLELRSKSSPYYRRLMDFLPQNRLALAWRVTASGAPTLSFAQFRLLVTRMRRTGHFDAHSIVRRTDAWWPIRCELMPDEDIARAYFTQAGKSATDPAAMLSFDEFVTAAMQLALKRESFVWYMHPSKCSHLTDFQTWRYKWAFKIGERIGYPPTVRGYWFW